MDIEFHYYMAYLIATKSGFGPNDATAIAYSSQYVDDNDMIYEVNKGAAQYYTNYISQTMNILKPKPKLLRIYPLFHFIPGDPQSPTAYRRDGKLHWLNTTPNSANANLIMDEALKTKNLYRIGIATHSYADSWAHQNFVGYYDDFNSMKGVLEEATPNIGHADAQHNPDLPALVWRDRRLLGDHARIDNKNRFLDAARNLFVKYRKYVDPACSEDSLKRDADTLVSDLGQTIGDSDPQNRLVDVRIARYIELSQRADYGDCPLVKYDDCLWMEAGVNEQVRGLRDRSDMRLARWDPLTDIYTWKDIATYQQTHWFRFQEAVKAHQNTAWDIMKDTTFSKLDLEEL